MDIDINRLKSLQEKQISTYYRQRAENEAKIEKIANAIKKYPDIGEKLGVDGESFSYQLLVPEAYKSAENIDKAVLREQTNKLQQIVVSYNNIVISEYEKAIELQKQADKIIGE